jgi:TonB family protein
MKVFFFFMLIVAFSTVDAQIKVTKYYNANWTETPKEKATFYADFVKNGENYNCTSYWAKTNILRGKSTYADTVMQFPIGLQVLYFKNGHIEDSSYFEDKKFKYTYQYYPNDQLALHYYIPENKKEGIAEGYDESGKKIRNYIFEKQSQFKGGQKAWASYINKNAAKDLTVKGNEQVTVTVQVEFIVDENGYVINPKILKSSGYKNVDNDALRIIADSPTWTNPIQFNKSIKEYKVQPIIYTLKPEKK